MTTGPACLCFGAGDGLASDMLRAIKGGTTVFHVPGRTIRHLDRDCGLLRHSHKVVEVCEVDLWPGFVCARCRTSQGGIWPYSADTAFNHDETPTNVPQRKDEP